MRNVLCLSVFLLVITHIHALTNTPFINISGYSLGFIESSDYSYVNPANLSFSKENIIEIGYFNEYEITQLSTYNIVYQQPLKTIDISAIMSYYGYENYNEITCGLNVSKLLNKYFSLGLRAYYLQLDYIDNQSTIGLLTADIGVRYIPVENIEFSCLLINPFRVSYRADDYVYNLPVSLIAGVMLTLTQHINSYVEVRRNVDNTINYKIGFEGVIYDKFYIKGGVITGPLIPTFGVGLRTKRMNIDTFMSWHSVLGISSGISLGFNLKTH